MLVGILSDSHGRHLAVRAAVALFRRLGAEHIIHCGDVGSERVFDELAESSCSFVWGNCDVPSGGLMAYVQTLGIEPPDAVPLLRTLSGKRFAVFHGHEREFDGAIGSLDVDYILHGHTHIARDERTSDGRIINPGALHRAREHTVATLDTTKDELTFHKISA